MLNSVTKVLLEQRKYWNLMFRMAIFDIKGMYQTHYLGSLWQVINPIIQIAIYWFVFGLGIRGGNPVDGVPFFVWLLVGLIPWLFISPSIVQGSNSVHQQVSLVSKMQFPVSILPTIKIISNSFQFIVMLSLLLIVCIIYNINFTIYIVQLPYYIFCLYIFLFSFNLLSSTIATLIRDYQMFLQSMMRMLLYLSPVLWDTSSLPEAFQNLLKLNPFYYIIVGFRSSILGGHWIYESPIETLYFWTLTFALLYFGSKIHLKFRKNFMDYL
ncbi:ABC transporter permease [Ornithinibacillus bavariensis]|uniref:Transport permease protein n=1 Tax=Ornithinibacillus bavariensis TaxID=545502 RepID=A0A919X8R6_9BACI|nr:ABC transporter permease [Ornithinibacillus bavariensis]GIO26918.1 teichoic acid translocation permease protein TagG [Ornithinibacillus bavariensis]